jgi:hypothetical protein
MGSGGGGEKRDGHDPQKGEQQREVEYSGIYDLGGAKPPIHNYPKNLEACYSQNNCFLL